MLRQSGHEKQPLLAGNDQPLQSDDTSSASLQSLPVDVLALIIMRLPFESAIALMLSFRKAFGLFDAPNRLNYYANDIDVADISEPQTIPYKQVNYLLLCIHFRRQELERKSALHPREMRELEERIKKTAFGIGITVGCVLCNAIFLPIPIMYCVSGPTGCITAKTMCATTFLGPLVGFATGMRSGVETYERTLKAAEGDQKRDVAQMSFGIKFLSLQDKTPLQLHSLFEANSLLRAKHKDLIADIAAGRPRRVNMEL